MLDAYDVAFIREHLRKEDLVLFLGAGLSAGLTSISGGIVPNSGDLTRQLWPIAFPESAFDERTSLQDVFDTARRRNPVATQARMQALLTIDPNAIPTHYLQFLAGPWDCMYSLNVDDLAEVAIRAPSEDLTVRSINAVTSTGDDEIPTLTSVDVVHLNGRISDGVNAVTFSEADFAARLAAPDGYYRACAVDILTKPTLFIGTRVIEPALYQSIQIRQRSVGTAELLPKSFLVATNVDQARQARLRDALKARYVDAAADDFIRWFVAEFAAELAEARSRRRRYREHLAVLASIDVADLRRSVTTHGPAIALGEEPTWHDVAVGPIPELSFAHALQETIASIHASGALGSVLVVAATAGNGKTTAGRSTALRLVAGGNRVAWIDASDQRFFDLAGQCRAEHSLARPWHAVFIDNAQVRVVDIVHEVRALRGLLNPPLVVLMARIGGLPILRERFETVNIQTNELILGPISDDDIQKLLEWLETIGRLGRLSGQTPSAQARAFRSDARRQLIVALIEATSGYKLKDRIKTEFGELDTDHRAVYALVALFSSMGLEVKPSVLVVALDAPPMRTQRAIADLSNVGLLRQTHRGGLTLRHRVIAELTLETLQAGYEFGPIVRAVLLRLAPLILKDRRKAYEYRIVRLLMNHDFLLRHFDAPTASGILAAIEQPLTWDHHYWLQRGSLALELKSYQDAEIFLLNAYGRNPDDPLVLTGLGNLRLRQAVASPAADAADALFEEGETMIRDAMAKRLGGDPHHFDILVRSMIDFAMRSDRVGDARRHLVSEAQSLMAEARRRFPNDERISKLREHVLHTLTGTGMF